MDRDYESYSVEDFLEDPFFIEWIKEETPESIQFWEGWILKGPENLKEFREAELNLRAMLSVKRIRPEEDDAAQVWSAIHQSKEKREGRLIGMRFLKYAAAIAIFVVAGYFLWTQFAKKTTSRDLTNKEIKNDIAPGGNKAILTLADGSKIILDSADNGAITKQGNITVIKLNEGEISYKPSTLNFQSSTVSYNTITTPRGGQYQLVLADGSKVWLNAESSLRFPTSFPGKERKVELTGEGYFEVAHNANKPFRVSVNDMTVEVLGTHFNINAYGDEDVIKTTLLQGSVRVSQGNESVKIRPGEQARLSLTHKLQIVNGVNLEEVVAWKDGKFLFDRSDINTVMHKLSRWYDMDYEIKGNIPQHFGGSISRNVPFSEVAEMLGMTGVINIEINGNKIIVTPREETGNAATFPDRS